MAASALGGQRRALRSLGFRPFFLAAGLWAPLALALWVMVLVTGETLPSRFDSLARHIHAMLFGFVLAAAAGFLLTAIPNGIGRQPVQARVLIVLVALWLLGRVVCLASASLPLWLAAAIDPAFPFALSALATREIFAARISAIRDLLGFTDHRYRLVDFPRSPPQKRSLQLAQKDR